MRIHSLLLVTLGACTASTSDTDPGDTASDTDAVDDTQESGESGDSDDAVDSEDTSDTEDSSEASDTDDNDQDGTPNGEDCRPDDPWSYPGAIELCDGLDNDCEPATTDEDAVTFFPTAGDPLDLTPNFDPTVQFDTAAGEVSHVTLTTAGTVRVCGGTHSGSLDALTGGPVAIEASSAFSRPVLSEFTLRMAGGSLTGVALEDAWVTFRDAAVTLDDVTADNTQITLSAGGDLVVEDSAFTGSSILANPGLDLQLRRVTVDGRKSLAFLTDLNQLSPDLAPKTVFAEDLTVANTPLSYANFQGTLRDVTTGVAGSLGTWTSLDVDGWVTSFGGASVIGTHHPGSTAVLKDVSGTIDSQFVYLVNLTSAILTDVDLEAGPNNARFLDVTDVAALTGTNVTFEGNDNSTIQATNLSAATVSFTDTTFVAPTGTSANPSRFLYLGDNTTTTLTRTSFDGGGQVAGVTMRGRQIEVYDSTFTRLITKGTGNTGAHGAGIQLFGEQDGVNVIDGTTFTDNTSSQNGSAIVIIRGSLGLIDSTLSGNVAPPDSSTYSSALYVDSAASATLTRTTLANNTGRNFAALRVVGTASMTDGAITGHSSVFSNGAAVGLSSSGVLTLTSVDLGDSSDDNSPHDIGLTDQVHHDVDGTLSGTLVCTAGGSCLVP